MLACVAQARAVEEVAVAARDDLQGTTPLELSHRICLTGEAVVDFSGELDCTLRRRPSATSAISSIATAGQ